nr:hypothetical protein [Tanacetum cinerariifolium]
MNVTLHIDGQSTEFDVLPDIIIDDVDEDDDITDDEDALRHDLAEYDNEDLINVDDDGVDKMSADVARSYGGNDIAKGKRKPNLGGRVAARLNTRDKTRNLSLKEITDTKGPILIQFELRDKQTVMPLDDHAAHWSSYVGEVIRVVPLYYPSWLKAANGIPRLNIDQHGNPAALAKGVQYRQGCFQGPALGYRPHDRDIRCGEDQAGPSSQPLRSTCRSLTHSSWHTLLMGNSFGMRTDVYT